MKRPRIQGPTIIRSSDLETNALIVRKSNQRRKRVEKTRVVERFIKNAFGTPGRFIYCNK
jgi:hypothetical protein